MEEKRKRGRPPNPKPEGEAKAKKRGRPFKPENPEEETVPIQVYPPRWLLDAFDQLKAEGLVNPEWSRSEQMQYAMAELVRQLTGFSPGDVKRRWGGRRNASSWLTSDKGLSPELAYKGLDDLLAEEAKSADVLDKYPDETEHHDWAYQWMNNAGKWERSPSYKNKRMAVEHAEFSVSEGRKARILFQGKVIKVLKPESGS